MRRFALALLVVAGVCAPGAHAVPASATHTLEATLSAATTSTTLGTWHQKIAGHEHVRCQMEVTEATGLTSAELEFFACAPEQAIGGLGDCDDTEANWAAIDNNNTLLSATGFYYWSMGTQDINGTGGANNTYHVTQHVDTPIPWIWRVQTKVVATDVDLIVYCTSW